VLGEDVTLSASVLLSHSRLTRAHDELASRTNRHRLDVDIIVCGSSVGRSATAERETHAHVSYALSLKVAFHFISVPRFLSNWLGPVPFRGHVTKRVYTVEANIN